jgi:hypothetical protein
MGLTAAVVDPLTDPAPAAWDEFVAAQRLLPMWSSQLLRTAAWCTQTPSSMVLVREPESAEPVALFYAATSARSTRPGSPGRAGCRLSR